VFYYLFIQNIHNWSDRCSVFGYAKDGLIVALETAYLHIL